MVLCKVCRCVFDLKLHSRRNFENNNEVLYVVRLILYRRPLMQKAEVKVIRDDPDIIDTRGKFTIAAKDTSPIYIPVHSKDVAGHCILSFQSDSRELGGLYKVRIKVKVVHHILFGYLAIALGWCYLACWCVTYYPQIYRNYARKSVVGFSFDYLALNLTGHLCYCIFNTAFYFNSTIQVGAAVCKQDVVDKDAVLQRSTKLMALGLLE